MLKLFLSIFVLFVSFNLKSQTEIRGNFQSMEELSKEIYLLAITDYTDIFSSTSRYCIDTAIVDDDGNFKFQLESLPCSECLYRIDVRPKESNGSIIFIGTSKENFALFELKENQTIKITGQAKQLTKTFKIESDSFAWSYEKIRMIREPVYQISDKLFNQFTDQEFLKGKNIDSLKRAGMKSLMEVSESNNKELLQYMNSSSNIYDKIIACKIYDFDSKMSNDLAVYEMISNQLNITYPTHKYLSQINRNIYNTNYVLPQGSTAPSLILPDIDGNLSDVKLLGENLILIDFWASWCSPCRHENRVTVKPLYNEFKEKGFIVYSVSMDHNKEKWINAIEKDSMNWVNVSDLLGNDSPVYLTYKIDALPTTYLIEKEGFKILAKNIRGEELRQFVEDYYKK